MKVDVPMMSHDAEKLFVYLFVCLFVNKLKNKGAWLAQSEEHATLDLRVVSSSPTLGAPGWLSQLSI